MKTTRIPLTLGLLLLLAAPPADAALVTWNFSGTIAPNTQLALPAISVNGVAGDTPKLTAAGIFEGASVTGSMTFETTEPDTDPDPAIGSYPGSGLAFTMGDLSVRTFTAAHGVTVQDDTDVATPPDPPLILDLLAFSGTTPAFTSPGFLAVDDSPLDPLDPEGPQNGTVLLFAGFPTWFTGDAYILTPPVFGFPVLSAGLAAALIDTDNGDQIQVVVSVTSVTSASAPDCVALGSADTDGDSACDDVDTCVHYPDLVQADTDGNGIGDLCECGDQGGAGGSGVGFQDGRVNLSDIFAVNDAILDPGLVTDLCDTNEDGSCNLFDIFGVNDKILGSPAFCSRFPSGS